MPQDDNKNKPIEKSNSPRTENSEETCTSKTVDDPKLLPNHNDFAVNALLDSYGTVESANREANHSIETHPNFIVTVVKTTHKNKSNWTSLQQDLSPTNLSTSNTPSSSSSNSSFPTPNTSMEHEQNLEKSLERKLLRKIEYYLMEISQQLKETEIEESGSGSDRTHKTNSDKCNTSHKTGSVTSAGDEVNSSGPGPSNES